LRHKLAVSTLDAMCDGYFRNVIGEVDPIPAEKVERLVICSGKVYYDLLEARRAAEADNVVIIRLEQLYPFPEEEFAASLDPYPNLKEVVWCQEEPMNQGAWYSTQHRLRRIILARDENLYLAYAGRDAYAAPAVGYASIHNEQQAQLVNDALFG
jgi:2-oxoglutarate dehydrogenase E1 component